MKLTSFLAAATLALLSATADADVVYTSRAAFQGATTGAAITDFEENGPGSFTFHGASYVGTGFTVSASNSLLFTVDPAFASYYVWNSGDVLDAETGTLTITLDASVRAFGFDFGNPNELRGTGLVTINGVDYALNQQPDFNFFGITSDAAIGAITVNFQGGLGIVDNVTVASVGTNQVPEPSSLALLGLALAGMSLIRRKGDRS